MNNTTVITIAAKPDVEINGAQSVCITDAAFTITTNILNGGLVNCPNTTTSPWSVVPTEEYSSTNTATFNWQRQVKEHLQFNIFIQLPLVVLILPE
ncbi:MAG: hypothetical protein U0T81_00835 [Saprospiraceae bacterium]